MWLASWAVIALLWLWYFAYRDFDRDSLALGGLTGIVLTIWAMEMTGNKVPSWMVPPPRKRYLPDPIPGEPAFKSNGKRAAVLIVFALAVLASLVWLRA
jgi:hypothetical protein